MWTTLIKNIFVPLKLNKISDILDSELKSMHCFDCLQLLHILDDKQT